MKQIESRREIKSDGSGKRREGWREIKRKQKQG